MTTNFINNDTGCLLSRNSREFYVLIKPLTSLSSISFFFNRSYFYSLKSPISGSICSVARKAMYSSNNKDLIDVLDENGVRTGEILSRKEIHTLGKIHRAVHLYLFDSKNNLLLQRRPLNADHYPGALSISLTGHINAGESSSIALYREVKEELNLDASRMRFHFLFSYRQDKILNSSYIDRQFNDVYACWYSLNIKEVQFNTNEVSEMKIVPFSKFKEMVLDEKSELAPVYLKEFHEISYFLNSNSLEFFVNSET